MIAITIYNQSTFSIPSQKIKSAVKRTLEENGIVSDAEVSLAIVGKKLMDELVKQYYQTQDPDHNYQHPVLSFPTNELTKGFQFPPDSMLHLGEIVISYPISQSLAIEENKLTEEVIIDLAIHGALHLLGKHHE